MDKARLYAALKRKDSGVFGTRLSQKQVESIEVIVDEAVKRGLSLRDLAYALATTYHEVGSAMQPISENLNYSSASRIRAVWPSRFKTEAAARPYVRNPTGLANKVYGGRLGNTAPDDGWIYRGRGFPQTTGKDNYDRSGKLVEVDLVKAPERMLDPRIAAATMIESMVRGLYTGKKLADYTHGAKPDYRGARAIINGDVKKNGSKVAEHAEAFEKALTEAGYTGAATAPRTPFQVPEAMKPAPPVAEPKPAVIGRKPASSNWLADLLSKIIEAWKGTKK